MTCRIMAARAGLWHEATDTKEDRK
jgi:hypothetical protein